MSNGMYESTGGVAQGATSGCWPQGEPQSVRDAADAKGGKGGKK